MRTVLKNIISRSYKPILERYLSRTRIYEQDGLRLKIPPEVFHPAFFTSTQFLLEKIIALPLKGKKLLELGAGSGLISMMAAKKGATVMASELNKIAVEYLAINCSANALGIEIRHSDLFQNIPEQQFDIIAINPPYYKKDPLSEKELAWYCGTTGEYFFRLFRSLPSYCNTRTVILMTLCDGCDLDMINCAAQSGGMKLQLLDEKQTLIEKNYIYTIS
jgi:release factor glutamine methyltransferase